MGRRIERARQEEGFTLIELLVVVIIIGILAAIAIPIFLNQRERAWNAAVQSDLRNAAVAAETFATDNNGLYDGMDLSTLEANGFNSSEGVNDIAITIGREDDTAPNNTAFCLTTNHEGNTTDYFYSSLDGAPEAGTCAGAVEDNS